MSNRDPLYGDSTHTDPFQAPQTGKSQDSTDQARDKADEAKAKGQQAMDQASQKGQQAKEKVDEASGMAQQRADQGMDRAAEGLDQASGMLRDRGAQQGGSMGSAATTAADTLESASSYLRSSDTDQMMTDLEDYIRRNPTTSLLAAAGVGFVLSKVFK